jgi:hypothetical protein
VKAGAELGFSPANRTRVQVANERADTFASVRDLRINPDKVDQDSVDTEWLEKPRPTDKSSRAERTEASKIRFSFRAVAPTA